MKILFADLRHTTAGRHSNFVPLALGFLASYAQKELGEDAFQFTIETDPDHALRHINQTKPDVVALSNYCWNTEANKVIWDYAKKQNPNTTCVGGARISQRGVGQNSIFSQPSLS
tara:strand:- start:1845 stop:2189 length:345 start_codon:yes stop_codon:yes gene_type:complete